MKTTWKIIKSETNRLKGHTVSKYENKKIMQSIRYSDTEGTSANTNPTYYLYKIYHNPFPNILVTFNNKSTKEIEGSIHSITEKNSHGYMELLQKC
jgi:hypothetical protein